MEPSRDSAHDKHIADINEWVDRLREYSAKKRQLLDERGYLSEQEERELIKEYRV